MCVRLMSKAAPFVVTLTALILSSVFAALWDTWPGDIAGIRWSQNFLNGITRPITRWANFLGDDPVQFGLVAATCGWLVYRRRPRLAALLAITVLSVTFLVLDLKWLVDRPSPQPGGEFQVLGETAKFAFPSGHVAFVALYFGILIYLVNRYWRGRKRGRLGLMIALFIPVMLIGPSRIAWGIHWPSDVLGGYLVAALALLVVRAGHRKFIDSPPSS